MIIEYIHTYSLIHDDLPCMDDDDMRRGNPSCHKMFGEATALLAGDALLTHAFDVACDANLAPEQINSALSLLSQNAGVGGMIGGQVLDLMYEKFSPSLAELLTVHKLKTGALISAACLLGCIAGNATDAQIAAASKFAYNLGIAFQIKDDLLDVYGDEAKLGKHVGSDEENNKTTYVTIVGKDRACTFPKHGISRSACRLSCIERIINIQQLHLYTKNDKMIYHSHNIFIEKS